MDDELIVPAYETLASGNMKIGPVSLRTSRSASSDPCAPEMNLGSAAGLAGAVATIDMSCQRCGAHGTMSGSAEVRDPEFRAFALEFLSAHVHDSKEARDLADRLNAANRASNRAVKVDRIDSE